MNINTFVQINNLQLADAVVLKKKFIGMVNHYVIYVGKRSGKHTFVANFIEGTQILPNEQINKQLEKYVPTKIDRCPGGTLNRIHAVDRAMSKIGEKAYNYIAYNCEHFKNWVHFGKEYSDQVDSVGNGLAVLGTAKIIHSLSKSDPEISGWGIGLAITGLLLKGFAKRANKE
jgi:hypothetical protein